MQLKEGGRGGLRGCAGGFRDVDVQVVGQRVVDVQLEGRKNEALGLHSCGLHAAVWQVVFPARETSPLQSAHGRKKLYARKYTYYQPYLQQHCEPL